MVLEWELCGRSALLGCDLLRSIVGRRVVRNSKFFFSLGVPERSTWVLSERFVAAASVVSTVGIAVSSGRNNVAGGTFEFVFVAVRIVLAEVSTPHEGPKIRRTSAEWTLP